MLVKLKKFNIEMYVNYLVKIINEVKYFSFYELI